MNCIKSNYYQDNYLTACICVSILYSIVFYCHLFWLLNENKHAICFSFISTVTSHQGNG